MPVWRLTNRRSKAPGQCRCATEYSIPVRPPPLIATSQDGGVAPAEIGEPSTAHWVCLTSHTQLMLTRLKSLQLCGGLKTNLLPINGRRVLREATCCPQRTRTSWTTRREGTARTKKEDQRLPRPYQRLLPDRGAEGISSVSRSVQGPSQRFTYQATFVT